MLPEQLRCQHLPYLLGTSKLCNLESVHVMQPIQLLLCICSFPALAKSAVANPSRVAKQETFFKPIALGCGHVMCKECLVQSCGRSVLHKVWIAPTSC